MVKNKGFNTRNGKHTGYTKGQRTMLRQRLDTKQEPKYTETNKTQVNTMKLTRTERDTGDDNERETLGQGKTKDNRGARLWP